MSDQNLIRIAGLSEEFNKTVEYAFGQNDELRAKALASLKPEELEKAQRLAKNLATMWLSRASDKGEPTEEFLKADIALIDICADVCLRIMPKEKVAACLPVELKNEDDAKFLRQLGAKHLAALCEFKK